MWVCGVFLLTPIYKFLLLNLLVLSLLVVWLGTRTKSEFLQHPTLQRKSFGKTFKNSPSRPRSLHISAFSKGLEGLA